MYISWLSPYAFKIGPIGVHWYGIFMVLAILDGGWYLRERGRQLDLDADRLSTITLWTILWGVVGARLVFVLANDPQWIWTDPVQALWTSWAPWTFTFNITRQPAITMPLGLGENGLPRSVQLAAAQYRDDLVLRAARVLELAEPVLLPEL